MVDLLPKIIHALTSPGKIKRHLDHVNEQAGSLKSWLTLSEHPYWRVGKLSFHMYSIMVNQLTSSLFGYCDHKAKTKEGLEPTQ